MRRSLTIAVFATLALPAAAVSPSAGPISLTLEPRPGSAAGDVRRDHIEIQSYSFGAALPAVRVNKVDGFSVKQKTAEASSGYDLGSWTKAEGLPSSSAPAHKPRGSNQMTMDDTAGAERSHQTPNGPYVLTGVQHPARLTVEANYPACRVGRRFPAATLRDGTKSYALRDLIVTQCAGKTVTFTYTVVNASP